MSTANKLTYLNGTKQAIKQAINEDFEVIDNNTTFREYAEEISSNNAKYKDLIPKETTNATNTLDISNSSGLDKALVTQYGNTYQETTTGQNLLPNNKTTETRNGVTFTVNSDKSVTITGTATVNTDYYFVGNWTNYVDFGLTTGTYNLNGCTGGSEQTYMLFTVMNRNGNIHYYSSTTGGRQMIVETGDTFRIFIRVISGTTVNTTIYPQINAGSTALPYEPYTGGIASPNPDYPQDIQVVSGDNSINVCGKNLIGLGTQLNGYVDQSTLKLQTNPGSIGYYFETSKLPNTITISAVNSNRANVCYFSEIPAYKSVCVLRSASNDNPRTITVDKTYPYIHIQLSYNFENVTNIQIEKGSTASDYEPYQEQSFDLDLKSKNLFDEIYLNIVETEIKYKSIYVGDGIFTMSSNAPLPQYDRYASIFFLPGKVTSGASTNINGVYQNNPITINSQNGYVTVGYRLFQGINPSDYEVMLNQGLAPIEYEPYYDINLCKIGTYKDRIYPLNGKWYLEKKINKVVLDGSEYWYNVGGNAPFSLEITDSLITISNDIPPLVYCDKFYPVSQNATWSVYDSLISTNSINNSTKIIRIRYTSISDLENFKTWLSTHNTILYYVLATPTTTEITDTSLLNQLNSIKLYEGVNNITITNESGLDVEFDIEYYKDWKLD